MGFVHEDDQETEDYQQHGDNEEKVYIEEDVSDVTIGGGISPGAELHEGRLRKLSRLDYSPQKLARSTREEF